jgi:hypothetical protein
MTKAPFTNVNGSSECEGMAPQTFELWPAIPGNALDEARRFAVIGDVACRCHRRANRYPQDEFGDLDVTHRRSHLKLVPQTLGNREEKS